MNGRIDTNMRTIVGTVIWLNAFEYGVRLKRPYLYVRKDVVYRLVDNCDDEVFEKFDSMKVEISGMLYSDEFIQVDTIDVIN